MQVWPRGTSSLPLGSTTQSRGRKTRRARRLVRHVNNLLNDNHSSVSAEDPAAATRSDPYREKAQSNVRGTVILDQSDWSNVAVYTRGAFV